MFVKEERVPISDDKGNTVYIRARMDLGTKNKFLTDMQKIAGTSDFVLGAYNEAILNHNILDWTGPAFEGVPCTQETIATLDPTEALIDRVIDEINTRNKVAVAPALEDGSPNPPPTSPTSGAGGTKGSKAP